MQPSTASSSSNTLPPITPITPDTFHETSLDHFIRHQVITHCWRCIEGEWTLRPISFVEDWTPENLRGMARYILESLPTSVGYMATDPNGYVHGFILLSTTPIGPHNEYLEVTDFQVSEPYRHRGLGRALFRLAANHARSLYAQKLYLSTQSSAESQAAYTALGCTHAQWLYPSKSATEPFDVQREYLL